MTIKQFRRRSMDDDTVLVCERCNRICRARNRGDDLVLSTCHGAPVREEPANGRERAG